MPNICGAIVLVLAYCHDCNSFCFQRTSSFDKAMLLKKNDAMLKDPLPKIDISLKNWRWIKYYKTVWHNFLPFSSHWWKYYCVIYLIQGFLISCRTAFYKRINLRQSHKYFQSCRMIFNKQNLYKTICLQLFQFPSIIIFYRHKNKTLFNLWLISIH